MGVVTTDHAAGGVYVTQRNVTDTAADVQVKVLLDKATLQPVNMGLVNTQ